MPCVEALERRCVLAEVTIGEFLVNSTTTGAQQTGSSQSVAASASGNSVVVWESYNQDALLTWGIYAQRLDASGARVGSETLVNTASLLDDQRRPSVAMNAAGQFAVAWEGAGLLGLFPGIYVQRFNSDGTAAGTETGVAGSILLDVSHASIGMAADGSFVIVYEAVDTLLSRGVFARRYDSSGSPLGAAFRVNPATAGLQQSPTVAVRSDGSFVVVWQGDGSGDSDGVFARAYDADGTAATGEVLINQTTAGSQGAPAIRVLETAAGGGFVIAWSGNGAADGSGVYVRAFDSSGTAIAGEQLVNQTTAGTQGLPSIGVDPDGDFIVTWSGSGTGDADGVFWREFAATGTARGGEARLPTTISGSQQRPSITGGGGDNRYVASWHGEGGADSAGVLAGILDNQAPTLGATGGTASYTENGAAVSIDPGLTVGDADSTNLTGATVWISGNFTMGEDALGFTNQLGISGVYDSGTGILTLSGIATIASYQTALRSVTYSNSSDNPSTASRTIAFTISDGTDTSSSATRGVTVLAVNDAPVVIASGGSVGYTENAAGVVIDAGISLSDVDSATLTAATVRVSVNFASGQDVLAFTDQLGISGSFDTGTGILTLSGSASLANYQTALRSITYANSSDNPSTLTRTIEFVVSDGAATSTPATRSVVLTAVNDLPMATTTVGAAAFTENGAPVAVDGGVTVSDVDSTMLAGATVRLSVNYVMGEDTLAFVNQLGITGSFVSGTGVLTLTGTATLADYQTALRSITYSNASDNPSTASRTIEFVVNDGTGDSSGATRSLTVTAINDPPSVVASGGSVAYTENSAGIVVDGGLSVSDVDSGTLTGATIRISVNFVSGQDTLVFVNQSGITGSYDAGTGILTLSGAASVASYQTALRSITYSNTSDNPTTAARTVEFIVNDGADSSAASVRTVSITAVNDVPVVSMSGGAVSFTENGPAVVIDASLTVSDSDSSVLAGATVRISANYVIGEDTLSVVNQLGITGTFDAGTGVLTLSGVASAVDYQLVLRSVTYLNGSDHPSTATRTMEVIVNDGAGDSAAATRQLGVNAVNDVPTIGITGGAAAYTENSTPVFIDGLLTVNDPDSTQITSATIRISANFASGQDVLVFTDQLGIAGSFNAGTGVLTLSGTATLASYQTALRSIRYVNSSDAPSTASRMIEFIVSDGAGNSAPATRSLTITAVNDAPLVSMSIGSATYIENGSGSPIDSGLSIADADSTALTGATVRITTGFVSSEDSLVFTDQLGIIGIYDPVMGTMTLSGAASLSNYQTALRSVRYLNTSENPNTASRVIEVVVSDGMAASLPATRSVAITAVNDAPLVSVTSGAANFIEGGSAIVIDGGLGIVDHDHASIAGATVRVGANFAAGQDVLLFTDQLGITGSYNSSTGLLTLAGVATISDYQAALRSVRYLNTSDNPNSATRTIEFVVSDGVDASTVGVRSLTITVFNNAPVLTASGGVASFIENTPGVAADPGIDLDDVDSPLLSSATVRIAAGIDIGDDHLFLPTQPGITAYYNAGTGTLTLSGSASRAAYESALRLVMFVNTSDNPGISLRTIEFSVHDGLESSAAVTRQVSVTAINDAPIVSIAIGSVVFTENASPVPIDAGLGVADPDTVMLTGATIRIVSGYASEEDLLVLSPRSGIVIEWDPETGTMSLSGAASLASYLAALRVVAYVNTSDAPSAQTRHVQFGIDDGLSTTTSGSIEVSVVPVDDAPIVSGFERSHRYSEKAGAWPVNTSVQLSDADSTHLAGAIVSIAAGFSPGEDWLSIAPHQGITAEWNLQQGVLTLSGTASVAAYTAALRSLTYNNTSNRPRSAARSVVVVIDDGTQTSVPVSASIEVTPVNDPPHLQVTASGQALDWSAAAAPLALTIVLTDPDSTDLLFATVRLSLPPELTSARLMIEKLDPLLTVAWNAATLELTLTGAAPIAAYQEALSSLFVTGGTGEPVAASQFEVEISVVDADGGDQTAQAAMSVLAAPTPPLPPFPPTPPPTGPAPVFIPPGGRQFIGGGAGGGGSSGGQAASPPAPVVTPPPHTTDPDDVRGEGETVSELLTPTVGTGTLAPQIPSNPDEDPPTSPVDPPNTTPDPAEGPPSTPSDPTTPGDTLPTPQPEGPTITPAPTTPGVVPPPSPIPESPPGVIGSQLPAHTQAIARAAASAVGVIERPEARSPFIQAADFTRHAAAALGVGSTTLLVGLSAIAASGGMVLLWTVGGVITARLTFASVLRMRGFDLIVMLRWWEYRAFFESALQRRRLTGSLRP